MKIPDEIVPTAYRLAKRVVEEKTTLTKAVQHLVDKGINKNSAADYIYAFKYMMMGEKFVRTLNAYSLRFFLNHIYRDYKKLGLANALKALGEHIPYYESHSKSRARTMRQIHAEFNAILVMPGLNEIEQEDVIDEIEKANLTRQQLLAKLSETRNEGKEKISVNYKPFSRDSVAIAIIKKLRGPQCQICETKIKKKNGDFYIEAAHIEPKRRKGRETPENIMLLCPNHHKEFDYGDVGKPKKNKDFVQFVMNGKKYKVSLKV